MAKVRGSAILGTLDYARTRFGEAAARGLVEGLPPAQMSVLLDSGGGGIAPHGWYETDLLVELTTRLDCTLGRGDLALAREAGKHVAFQDVNRFFKWLMRLGGPTLVFNRAGAVWNNYYDDGRYLVESVGEDRGALRIEGSSSACPVVCKRIEGWMERALELTIGPAARPTIREEAHLERDSPAGPTYCRFVAAWNR
jgi:hypothetical protein